MAAADALTGRNVWLGIGKQSAFGTPVVPTKFYEVTDLGGLLPEYEFKTSERRVGTRFKALGYKASKKVPFNFAVEANPQNIGLLLTLAMGTDSVAASGAAYAHTISLAENLSYFTIWVSTDDVADPNSAASVHQIANCKINSGKFDGVVSDVAMFTVEGFGTTRAWCYKSSSIAATGSGSDATITTASTEGIVVGASASGTNVPASTTVLSITDATHFELSANLTDAITAITIAAPVPTFPTARPFYQKAEEGQAKLEIGANTGALAQFDESTEFHIELTSGVNPDMRIDNTTEAAAIREGDSEFKGTAKVIYNRNSWAEVEAFQAGTTRAIRFTNTSEENAATGVPFSLVFLTDLARYSGAPVSWDPDVISADLEFEVQKSTSYPSFVLTNADSAAY